MKNVIVVVLLVLAFNSASLAITIIDDGLSHTIGDTIYQNEILLLDYYSAVSPGTHVNLIEGGSVEMLKASHNATILMSGGSIGENLEGASKIDVTGGTIGMTLNGYDNSEVTVTAGSMQHLGLHDSSTLSFSGGLIGGYLTTYDNAVTNMSGGVAHDILSGGNGRVDLSGGHITGMLQASEDAFIFLKGTNFEINGYSLAYNDKLTDYANYDHWGEYYYGTVSGILADGSALNCTFNILKYGSSQGIGDIVIIPEPAMLSLFSLGGLLLRKQN